MKKLFLTMALLFLFTVQANAELFTHETELYDTSNVILTNYALTSGSAVYSRALNVSDSEGYLTLFIIEDKSGGGGDVDISVEYSIDGTNFYTPYTSDLSGAITADGNLVTTLGNVTRWIVVPTRVANYVRFKFDPDANSEITAHVIWLTGKK